MKLILGTVQFGLDYGINNSQGKPSFKTICNILDIAFDNKVKYLDTAEAYGDSQEVIGEYHGNSQNRFKIITKFSSSRKDLDNGIIKRVKQNVAILNVDALYAYMFHSLQDFKTYHGLMKNEIMELKKIGLIEKFGVSIYTNEEFEEVISNDQVDLIQIPFNLLDNMTLRGELIKRGKDHGKIIHTRSAFLQGLFFRNPKDDDKIVNVFKESLVTLNEIAEQEKMNIASLALNYCLQQDLIDNVLIGVDSLNQMQQNLMITGQKLSNGAIRKINEIKVDDPNFLNPSTWN